MVIKGMLGSTGVEDQSILCDLIVVGRSRGKGKGYTHDATLKLHATCGGCIRSRSGWSVSPRVLPSSLLVFLDELRVKKEAALIPPLMHFATSSMSPLLLVSTRRCLIVVGNCRLGLVASVVPLLEKKRRISTLSICLDGEVPREHFPGKLLLLLLNHQLGIEAIFLDASEGNPQTDIVVEGRDQFLKSSTEKLLTLEVFVKGRKLATLQLTELFH